MPHTTCAYDLPADTVDDNVTCAAARGGFTRNAVYAAVFVGDKRERLQIVTHGGVGVNRVGDEQPPAPGALTRVAERRALRHSATALVVRG